MPTAKLAYNICGVLKVRLPQVMEQIYPMYKMGESESAERAGPSSPVPMRLEL